MIRNTYTRVWSCPDTMNSPVPIYLGSTGVRSIQWENKNVAHVTLYTNVGADDGPLQAIMAGERIEVLYGDEKSVPPNVYDKNYVWLAMEDIWDLCWTITEPVALSPDAAGVIEFELAFRCRLTERDVKCE